MRLCHLAAPSHCLPSLSMAAGSSCFCLLCHPSAGACQFHYHAPATLMGHRPGLPKVKNYVFICVHVCVKPNITEAPPRWQTSKCPFALRRLPIDAMKMSCVHGQSVYVSVHPHRPTHSFTHTHTRSQKRLCPRSLC